MVDEPKDSGSKNTGTVSDEQFMRAARAFEAIIVSQIEIKEKLADDLKNTIRVGMVILGLVALSIFLLLFTLSSQITRISDVVADMNIHFGSITIQMEHMSRSIDSMEQRVALLEQIEQQIAVMHQEMDTITRDMESMHTSVNGIDRHVYVVRNNVANISNSINLMDDQVQLMSRDMQHMSQPARTMQKMFPIP